MARIRPLDDPAAARENAMRVHCCKLSILSNRMTDTEAAESIRELRALLSQTTNRCALQHTGHRPVGDLAGAGTSQPVLQAPPS